ncbi:hypothetical protein FNV43_RR13318 [Rhamnella rubrinervis]|uniref:Protein kinase domain-containing protein n=1 Tax=Rhamnella rubrinervis TaxID=2594499 RepID=A0A8K0H0Z4_9ROSA|nr:hypothetical protein FNV43_RR13318 [Rhamnella rubrinervis]
MKPATGLLWLLVFVSLCFSTVVKSKCSKGCDVALASYWAWDKSNLTFIGQVLGADPDTIVSYNKDTVPSKDQVPKLTRVNVPFSCECIRGEFLGHEFLDISKEYGLFITYPLRPGEALQTVAGNQSLDPQLLQRYNEGVNFSRGTGLVFIPGKGLSGGLIAGIVLGAVAGILLLAFCVYVSFYRNKKADTKLLPAYEDHSSHDGQVDIILEVPRKAAESTGPGGTTAGITSITIDKSVEFSYEELAQATNDFNMACKIGEGGFGAVYYAELRGEKAAIKKMDMQASKEFLAELRVLTRVHHLNLVRLIGYCVEGSLFLVYEYIENGNLSEHLRGTGREPLPWAARVQIALDSARGLEYIHEHTVADFGLTKLTEVGSTSQQTRLVGTFGYMPPEYAQYGDISPKVDVYAFGVVLYELISSKEAVVKGVSLAESKGLVGLFEDVLNQPDPREDLSKLVDPRLGDNYPLDAVRKDSDVNLIVIIM